MRYNKEEAMKLVESRFSIDSILMKSNLKHNHVAIIIKRGKILGMATNFVGTRNRGCGYDNRSIHAERAVLKQLGDHTKLNGAIMIVIRISREIYGGTANSKPCHACQCHLDKCVKDYGLRRIYYSE